MKLFHVRANSTQGHELYVWALRPAQALALALGYWLCDEFEATTAYVTIVPTSGLLGVVPPELVEMRPCPINLRG